MIKKTLTILLAAVLLAVPAYWAYFNMRYKIIYREGSPFRYDTWANEFSHIRYAKPTAKASLETKEHSAASFTKSVDDLSDEELLAIANGPSPHRRNE